MKSVIIFCAFLAAAAASPRIIGGDLVDIREIPYQVSVEKINVSYSPAVGPIGGGVVINKRFVLTAANGLLA